MTTQKHEELARTLFEQSGDALFLFDPESQAVLDANPMAQRLSGLSRAELTQFPIHALLRAETPSSLTRLRDASLKTGFFHSQEGFFLRQKGDAWLRVNLTLTRFHVVGQRTLGIVSARDMSEQWKARLAEGQLATQKRVLESVVTGGSVAEVMDVLLRATEEQCPGMLGSVLLLHEDGQRLFHCAAPSLPLEYQHSADGITIGPCVGSCGTAAYLGKLVIVGDIENDPLWADGRHIALAHGLRACWSAPILARTGSVLGTFACYYREPRTPAAHELRIIEQSTQLAALAIERKRDELAIRSSEAKYRTLIENLAQGVFLKDTQSRFAAANRAAWEWLGCTSEAEVVGRTVGDFFPHEVAVQREAEDRQVFEEGQRVEVEEERTTDVQTRTIRTLKTPVREDGRTVGVLGIFWDVTEQRALQAQLLQAQKMEAIGQLAGGIAHDFNNILTAVLGNITLLMQGFSAGDPNRELCLAAEKAALRAATLTTQLLGFARRTVLRPQPADLNENLDEVLTILRPTIDPRVVLQASKAPDLWTVRADPGQMTQIIMNLCLNARDAMPEGGTLSLETANVVVDAAHARDHLGARTGEHVRLSVVDSGQGIPAELRSRIFEPFFTTKPKGKGTGLGLAMVFGIAQQHNGWVECQSEVGQGTRFDIYLPRIAGAGWVAVSPAAAPAAGHETVLLVDDEEMIRIIASSVLARYGYQVLLAADGEEALDVYQRAGNTIDLVILDLTMPKLSGHDTFRRLLQFDPKARVLFASGFSEETLNAEEQEVALGFLSKPYRPEELAHAVRAALDRER
jgi:PAS domain S-box-containing protein